MLGITIGDPSGIGPEIVLKALSASSLRAKRGNLLLIGNKKILEELNHKVNTRHSQDSSFLSRVNLVESSGYFSYKFGKPQKQCGISSALQLHLASHLLKVGKIKGIVTAPVSKTALTLAGFPFPGQTEYFATEFGVKKYAMLAWSEQVKIILVTIHKPLKEVPKLITTENVLEKIILLNDYLVRYEKIRKPRIGVFALNPHAFEFTCGAENKILKAIKQARKLGISCDGPLPADSAFSNLRIRHSRCERPKGAWQSPEIPRYTRNDPSGHLRIAFDAYVAMYHDQGMLPVKLLSQGKGACPAPISKKGSAKYSLMNKPPASYKNWCGVNITLGLPFIRTSPLHGVAFDIAGKGIANPNAMLNAIQLCQKLTQHQ